MQTSPDHVGIAREWLSKKLGSSMTEEWYPKKSDDSGGHITVSGSLKDKTGENRISSVLMTKDGMVNENRSFVSSKRIT